MPRFSIIVPVYNNEEYLRSCIESILCQTYHDFEILLVDDGSTDNSGSICDEFACNDKRIRVFHKANGGVSSARNLALEYMEGERFLFVDSDDEIAHNTLEKCAWYLDKGEIDILQFHYSRDKSSLGLLKKETSILTMHDYLLTNDFLVCAGGSVFRSDFVKKNKIRFREDVNLAEDQMFIYDCFGVARQIQMIPDVLYYYRRNERSAVSLSKSCDMYNSSLALIEYKKNRLLVPMIDRVLLMLILSIIGNHDLPYHSVKELYKSCGISNLSIAVPNSKLFHCVAKVSFNAAYRMARLYHMFRNRRGASVLDG